MWDLGKPGARFPPNHPKALLEEPQAFQAVGEQCIFTAQRQIPNVFQGGIEHVLWQEFPCIKSHHSSVLKGLERLGLYQILNVILCVLSESKPSRRAFSAQIYKQEKHEGQNRPSTPKVSLTKKPGEGQAVRFLVWSYFQVVKKDGFIVLTPLLTRPFGSQRGPRREGCPLASAAPSPTERSPHSDGVKKCSSELLRGFDPCRFMRSFHHHASSNRFDKQNQTSMLQTSNIVIQFLCSVLVAFHSCPTI